MVAQDEVVGSRRRLFAVIIATLVLVSPALRDHDSFPLSTYPVYASARSREATFVTAHGEDANGAARRLSIDVIARTDDPLIAASRVEDAVAAGMVEELCAQIAARAPSEMTAVVVVRERHDVVAGAQGKDSLLRSEQLTRCVVTA